MRWSGVAPSTSTAPELVVPLALRAPARASSSVSVGPDLEREVLLRLLDARSARSRSACSRPGRRSARSRSRAGRPSGSIPLAVIGLVEGARRRTSASAPLERPLRDVRPAADRAVRRVDGESGLAVAPRRRCRRSGCASSPVNAKRNSAAWSVGAISVRDPVLELARRSGRAWRSRSRAGTASARASRSASGVPVAARHHLEGLAVAHPRARLVAEAANACDASAGCRVVVLLVGVEPADRAGVGHRRPEVEAVRDRGGGDVVAAREAAGRVRAAGRDDPVGRARALRGAGSPVDADVVDPAVEAGAALRVVVADEDAVDRLAGARPRRCARRLRFHWFA